jgi:hypothetical protein
MTKRSSNERGYTLVETAMVAVLLVPLLLAALQVPSYLAGSFHTTVGASSVRDRSDVVFTRLAGLLRPASAASLRVPNGAVWVLPVDGTEHESVRFQHVLSLPTPGAPALGPVRTLEFVLAPGEQRNNLDDDRDGVADNGSIVMTEADGTRITLASGVQRFLLRKQGRTLWITLECAAADRRRRVHLDACERDLLLHNY